MNIVLIGFMGTGKSAVGHALAKRLRARYLDTDAEIEQDSGKHVKDIFAHEGETVFRRLETDVLMRLTREHGPLVVATGGGTPLREENVRLLKMIGPIVWLTAPPEAILGRIRRNLERRPMLASHEHDPLARIQHLLKERTPIYRAVKDYEFDTTNWDTPEETAACILSILGPSKEPCPPPHTMAPESQAPKKKTLRLGLHRD
jgi:shikimate kinase